MVGRTEIRKSIKKKNFAKGNKRQKIVKSHVRKLPEGTRYLEQKIIVILNSEVQQIHIKLL